MLQVTLTKNMNKLWAESETEVNMIYKDMKILIRRTNTNDEFQTIVISKDCCHSQ